MLWVYINNQGVAECVVNVGNRIRQGDAIDMFLVLEGMQDDVSIYEPNRISYLKPGNKEFVLVSDAIGQSVERTFVLGDPSMANSHFVAPNEYLGYPISIPSDATSFSGNGGHVAFEIVMTRKSDGQYLHAQTLSVFVEPTYGKYGNTVTSADYSTLVDMLRLANCKYAVSMSVYSDAGVSLADDDPNHSPVLIVGETSGFVRGKVKIDLSGWDDSFPDSDYVSLCYTSVASLELPVESVFLAHDQYGNTIRMKVTSQDSGINVEANVEDIRQSGEDEIVVSYFGTCSAISDILDFSTVQEGIVNIIGASATAVSVDSDYSGDLVELSIVSQSSDPTSGTLSFEFFIPKGEQGEDGADGLPAKISFINGSVGTTQYDANVTPPASTITASVTGPYDDNGYGLNFDFGLKVNKGRDGVVTESPGAIGFTTDDNGDLILITADGNNHSLYLVSDDSSSPSYYGTLGVSSDWVGDIVIADGDVEGSYGTYHRIYAQVTHATLLADKNNGDLVPGCAYRITDYVATTTTADTSSAGHQFDLIVVADSESSLNENAKAVLHEGDSHFAGCDLGAWEIKYCIENDTSRFAWADSVGGKGVIYYMKDEWGNSAFYDFKGLLFDDTDYIRINGNTSRFRRNVAIDADGRFGWTGGSTNGWTDSATPSPGNPVYPNSDGTGTSLGLIRDTHTASFTGAYTFNVDVSGSNTDASINGARHCANNRIGPKNVYLGSLYHELPFIVFLEANGCHDCVFDEDCNHITLASACISNRFGRTCREIDIGSTCSNHTFAVDCNNIEIGTNTHNCTFGNSCRDIVIGNNCTGNRFGNSCRGFILGNDSPYNRFGDNCSNLYLADNCTYVTVGNGGTEIKIGANSNNIAFGTDCAYIEFATTPSGVLQTYVRDMTFGNSCKYLLLYCSNDTVANSGNYLQNVNVKTGTMGSSSSNRLYMNIADRALPFVLDASKSHGVGARYNTDFRVTITAFSNGTLPQEYRIYLTNGFAYVYEFNMPSTGRLYRYAGYARSMDDETTSVNVYQSPVTIVGGSPVICTVELNSSTYEYTFHTITL